MEDIVSTVWRLIKEKSSVRRVSMEMGLDRASLYQSFKKGTNPRIDTLMKFLNHLGYRLQIVKTKKKIQKPSHKKRRKLRKYTQKSRESHQSLRKQKASHSFKEVTR
jgi:hypothetical protein